METENHLKLIDKNDTERDGFQHIKKASQKKYHWRTIDHNNSEASQ